jgi:hypothetical protein
MTDRINELLDQIEQSGEFNTDQFNELVDNVPEGDEAAVEYLETILGKNNAQPAKTVTQTNGHYSAREVTQWIEDGKRNNEQGYPALMEVTRGFCVAKPDGARRFRGTNGMWVHRPEAIIDEALWSNEDDAAREAILLYRADSERAKMTRLEARQTSLKY